MLFLCIHSKWLLGKGEKVFFQSLSKRSTAEWPWVMLCSLAVFSLSSDPPGVALECLKLLNVFLNGPFPHHKEGCGDRSDLWSGVGVAENTLLLIRDTVVKIQSFQCAAFIFLTCICLLVIKSCPLSSEAPERCAVWKEWSWGHQGVPFFCCCLYQSIMLYYWQSNFQLRVRQDQSQWFSQDWCEELEWC